jgi:hydroxyacylglutathione hydrolase
LILKQFEVGTFSVFAYLLAGEPGKDGFVIDPAADIDKIIAYADQQKITIKYIVNTHAHVDHVMGNGEMKRKTGAKIIIHEEDAPLLTHIPRSMLAMFGGRPSPPADQIVREGDLIRAGDLTLKVLHTPGHTPGGMCLHSNNVVFTGDTLFVGSVGRTDLPGSSWPVMLQSIKTKLLTLPDETIVYPGHHYGSSPASTIKNERLYNPFLN